MSFLLTCFTVAFIIHISTMAAASPVPTDHCVYNLVGNMEGTRGCMAQPHLHYIAIQCDGKSQASLLKMLQKYNQYACRKPLRIILIERPQFPLTPELFSGVADRLYRLELFELNSSVILSPLLHSLPRLEALTLQFSEKPHNQTFVVSSDFFSGLGNLRLLRLYTNQMPVRIERGAFSALQRVQCLHFSGENAECGLGFDDLQNWKHSRKTQLRKMHDHYAPYPMERCHFTVACRPWQVAPVHRFTWKFFFHWILRRSSYKL